jgi:acetylornithine aminotransferase
MQEYQQNILSLHDAGSTVIVQAKDCYLYDIKGKQYTDFEAGVWCAILGHCNATISAVMGKQSSEVFHLGYRFVNDLPAKLSYELVTMLRLQGGKVVFLSSGSEAVNLAITIAREITGRQKILTIENSYLSAYGHAADTTTNSQVSSIANDDYRALKQIDFSGLAAFIFEPGTSSGMIHFPTREFISAIGEKAGKNKCPVIIDEVTTGFGRTGSLFGYEHYDLKPDMVACGKGMGNGYPVSAVVVSAAVSSKIEAADFRYVQSHQNDPLGCAVALKVIDIIRQEDLVRRGRESGKLFRELLDVLAEKFTEIIEVRSRGLMLAVEFRPGFDILHLWKQLLDKGFVTGRKNNMLRFMPPLTIKESDIIRLVKAMEESMSREGSVFYS